MFKTVIYFKYCEYYKIGAALIIQKPGKTQETFRKLRFFALTALCENDTVLESFVFSYFLNLARV